MLLSSLLEGHVTYSAHRITIAHSVVYYCGLVLTFKNCYLESAVPLLNYCFTNNVSSELCLVETVLFLAVRRAKSINFRSFKYQFRAQSKVNTPPL
jgi:hypothetical protein